MENKMLNAALEYLKLEWNVIPVGANKRPPEGFSWKQYQTERVTEAHVREWWTRYPNFGIAVITGKISGIIVLDVDTKHKRDPKDFDIPATVTARTQSGGWHYYFRYPGEHIPNSGGKLFGEGVDVRGDGGYAVLPPTKGENGSYYWEVPPSTITV